MKKLRLRGYLTEISGLLQRLMLARLDAEEKHKDTHEALHASELRHRKAKAYIQKTIMQGKIHHSTVNTTTEARAAQKNCETRHLF